MGRRTVAPVEAVRLRAARACALLLLFLLALHGAAPAAERRTVRVMGDRDYPPIIYLEDDVPKGFDVDIVKALGDALGWEVTIDLMPWELAQKAVLDGKGDLITGMGITETRRSQWDFATPTLTHAYQLFVSAGDVRIQGVGDLSDRRVGVTVGSLPKAYFEKRPDVQTVLIANYEQGFELLRKGTLDAVAADAWVGGYVINKQRIEGVATAGPPFARLDAAIAVPRGNEALLAEVNRGLRILGERGTISEIRAKWEPKQVVWLLQEDVRAATLLAAGLAALVVFGGMAAWIFTLRREIAVRRRIERELRTSEERFRVVFEEAPVGISLRPAASRSGSFMRVNQKLCEILGYSREELRRLPLSAVSPEDDQDVANDYNRRVLAGEMRGYSRVKRYIRKDGTVIWTNVALAGVPDPDGTLAHLITVIQDITDEKRMGEELERYRDRLEELVRDRTAELEAANSELQAFTYTVSHDLRAPLRAIIGFATILQGRITGADEQALLGRIARNAQRLGEMVDELLDFSRLGRGELAVQRFDPNGLVAEVVESACAPYPRATVTTGPLPEMVGDPVLLRQVFENLIGNALKFSSKVAAPQVEIGALATDGETAFFVRDNGAGFDMKHAEELFAVFRRLHARDEFEGSGVGLATVQRIVARHGGRIWAESAPQAGATFYFTLKSA